MPELPEVETVRRGLERAVVGRTAVSVAVSGTRSVRRQPINDFHAALCGQRLVRAGRLGKYLLVNLFDGSVLVIHLRMSGQLRYVSDPATPSVRHTHVVLVFEDESELRFVDPRTFGEMFVVDDLDERGIPRVLGHLGPDPLADGLDVAELRARLSRRRTSIKAFLLDQSAIAGIGNIYGDEICFVAKIRPDRRSDTLTAPAVKRLGEAIRLVLSDAVERCGSTLRDASYLDLFGQPGSFQSSHAAYDRAGLGCVRCSGTIRRIKVAGRSSYFCPKCQR